MEEEKIERVGPMEEPLMGNIVPEDINGLNSLTSSDSDSEKPDPSVAVNAPIYRMFGRERPIHMVLGGGKPADLLLWRDKKVTAGLLAVVTVVWLLFGFGGCRLLTFISRSSILFLLLSFLWSNVLNRSMDNIMEIYIPEKPLLQAASVLIFELNCAVATLRSIALERDIKNFAMALIGLWLVSIIGNWFSFLSLLYFCFVLVHTLPMLYERYEDEIDPIAEKATIEIMKHYQVFAKTFFSLAFTQKPHTTHLSLSLAFSLSEVMDATKWTQGFQEMMNVKPMEQMMIPNNNNSNNTSNARPNTILTSNGVSAAGATVSSGVSNNNNNNSAGVVVERKARPQEKLNCPRCNSTNTKFCYYNNYSLTQPRYFCKGCRRYWTEGGSLRNVPVGGSSRKNKRSISSSSTTSNILQTTPSSLGLTTTHQLPDLNPPILFSNQKPKGSSQDLNLLSFPVMQDQHHHVHMSQFLQMPKMEGTHHQSSSSLFGSSSSPVSALELLRTGVNASSRSFMPPGPMMDSSNNLLYTSSGFPTMVDYKPSNNLSFSSDHHHQGLEHNNNRSNDQGRLLFPFGDQMKELSSSITQEVDHEDNQQQKSHGDNNNNNNNNSSPNNNGYWSGMFSTTGGGSSW